MVLSTVMAVDKSDIAGTIEVVVEVDATEAEVVVVEIVMTEEIAAVDVVEVVNMAVDVVVGLMITTDIAVVVDDEATTGGRAVLVAGTGAGFTVEGLTVRKGIVNGRRKTGKEKRASVPVTARAPVRVVLRRIMVKDNVMAA